MKKYFYLLIPILFVIFSSPTYAYTNTDTAWIIENNNQKQRLQNTVCGNETAYDVIKDFIENFDVDNAYANVEIYLTLQSGGVQTANNISFYVWPKSYPMRSEFWAIGRPNYGTIYFTTEHYYETFTSGQYFYYIEIKAGNCSSNSSNITSANGWQSFLTFVNTGVLNSSQSTSTVSSFNKHSAGAYSPYWNDTTAVVNGSNLGIDVNENSLTIPYNWIYYSSRPFILGFSSTCSNPNIFCKNVILNGVEYTSGDTIPDTYTIDEGSPVPPEPTNLLKIYDDNLKTFYVNFDPSDISSFSLDINFVTDEGISALDYVNNYYYRPICSARINNNDNYYTYVNIPCTIANNGDFDPDSYTVNYLFEDLEFYDSNDNLITDFSSYDKLYFTLVFNNKSSNVSTILHGLNSSSSVGNLVYEEYLGSIFENFDNLPLLFKLYLSSNSQSMYDVYSSYVGTNLIDSYSIYWQGYDTTTLAYNQNQGTILDTRIIKINVSNFISNAVMIYQNDPVALLPSLYLFFDSTLVISLRDSTNNNFYYIDDNNIITNSSLNINYESNFTYNYNMVYYERKILNYLESFSPAIYELNLLTQNIYDNFPIELQTFLFIMFILFCYFILFKLIRR